MADLIIAVPGAQVTYVRSGQIVKNTAYGFSYLYTDGNFTKASTPIATATDTIWDLASMSKLVTTTLAMVMSASSERCNLITFGRLFMIRDCFRLKIQLPHTYQISQQMAKKM